MIYSLTTSNITVDKQFSTCNSCGHLVEEREYFHENFLHENVARVLLCQGCIVEILENMIETDKGIELLVSSIKKSAYSETIAGLLTREDC